MNTPSSPESQPPRLSQDLLLKLKTQTSNVLNSVAELLQSNTLEDEADKKMIEEAVAFLENPTEEISEIKTHATHIGVVMGGFEMQGAEVPPAIDNMHRYLLILSCINRIAFVENEIEKGSPDLTKIKDAMVWAVDPATHLSRGYKDDTCLHAVTELQQRLA